MFRVLTPVTRIYYHLLSLLSPNTATGADGNISGKSIPETVFTVVRAPDDGC